METVLPPGPGGPRLSQLAPWLLRPVPYATRLQRRHGDMFTLHVEPTPWVMLSDPEHVKQVFTGDPELLHAGEANEILRPILGARSVLLLDGREHLRQRKLMLPSFHGERMQRYREIMEQATERAIASWPRGEPFALRPSTQAITLEVIMRAVFGLDDGAAMTRLRPPLERLLAWSGNMRGIFLLAALGPDNALSRRETERLLGPVDDELLAIIAQRRRAPDLAERDDVLSTLLQARDEDGAGLTDRELRDELMTLLVAGHETTATSLAWAAERLTRRPGALERVAEDEAYADAVVKETLRLRPVIAIVLRVLKAPMEIGGRLLPAGVKVAPCILLVHRRADLYPEPLAFRPERWLDGDGPGTYGWIPFGGGVRRCVGAAFAQLEMQVVLRTIARHVELEAVGPPEPVRRRAITFVPGRGGEVRVAGTRDRVPRPDDRAAALPAA